jgi:hypothetical protein
MMKLPESATTRKYRRKLASADATTSSHPAIVSIPLVQSRKAASRASAAAFRVVIPVLRNALKHLENYAKVTNTIAG